MNSRILPERIDAPNGRLPCMIFQKPFRPNPFSEGRVKRLESRSWSPHIRASRQTINRTPDSRQDAEQAIEVVRLRFVASLAAAKIPEYARRGECHYSRLAFHAGAS